MSVTAKVRQLVYEREAGYCVACANYALSGVFSVHHRRTKGMGEAAASTPTSPKTFCSSAAMG